MIPTVLADVPLYLPSVCMVRSPTRITLMYMDLRCNIIQNKKFTTFNKNRIMNTRKYRSKHKMQDIRPNKVGREPWCFIISVLIFTHILDVLLLAHTPLLQEQPKKAAASQSGVLLQRQQRNVQCFVNKTSCYEICHLRRREWNSAHNFEIKLYNHNTHIYLNWQPIFIHDNQQTEAIENISISNVHWKYTYNSNLLYIYIYI